MSTHDPCTSTKLPTTVPTANTTEPASRPHHRISTATSSKNTTTHPPKPAGFDRADRTNTVSRATPSVNCLSPTTRENVRSTNPPLSEEPHGPITPTKPATFGRNFSISERGIAKQSRNQLETIKFQP